MSTERWERIKQILEDALQLTSDQRQAYLDSVCGTDRELRSELESLIDSNEAAGSQFLAVPAPDLLLHSSLQGANTPLNQMIGPYRLMEELGRGGMGQVWLAEQTAPLNRQVALKLIKGGMFDRSALQRFQSERQSLAIMDHPSIAKVFDAAATPDGQPYFVMEYVPGVPITDYCDQKKLKIFERLELFIKVCEGVQHAHQKAIIHRDLKPANILVVEVDEKPLPRIIDFGLAKSAAPEMFGAAQFTMEGSFLGTPGYMSPEQADPTVHDVDTRTDVYSLGAILYVLLSGSLPFDTEQWGNQPLDEALRQLREEDPPRPSTKASKQRDSTKTAAEARGAQPKELVSLLRGDLDWITIKALERDRARRYATPSELAADCRRYLQNEPVQARPASVSYRIRKYVRRHRIGVAVAGMLAAILVTFAVVQSVQLRTITRERNRADTEAATAKAINEFLRSDLLAQASASAQANPDTKPDPDIKVRTALDRASARIAGKFDKQPLVEAGLRQTVGNAYKDLGLFAEAQPHLQRSLDLRRLTLGEQDPETLRSMIQLAELYEAQAKYVQAEPLLVKSSELQRRILGENHRDTLHTLNSLGEIYVYQGKLAQAEELFTKLYKARLRSQGEHDPDTLETLNDLGTVLGMRGKFAEAEPLLIKALEISKAAHGEEHPDTLVCMNNLAVLYNKMERAEESDGLYSKTLEVMTRVLGPEHPSTLLTMQNLGLVKQSLGSYRDAEALLAKALAGFTRVLGPEHMQTVDTTMNLGVIYDSQGRFDLAEQMITKSLEMRQRVFGPQHPSALFCTHNLARVYREQGKYKQSEELYLRVIEARRRTLGEEDPNFLDSLQELGVLYFVQERLAEAEPLFASSLDTLRRVFPNTPSAAQGSAWMGKLRMAQHRELDAEPFLREALSIQTRHTNDWHLFETQSLLGSVLSSRGQFAEAEPLLVEGYTGLRRLRETIPFERRSLPDVAGNRILALYAQWGKPNKAAEWREKLQMAASADIVRK